MSGCVPGCIACRSWPGQVPDLSRMAEVAEQWERIRRELADPYSPLLQKRLNEQGGGSE